MLHIPVCRLGLKALVVFSICWSQVVVASEFCEELVKFAHGLAVGDSREITLFTEWSAQPTRACRHSSDKVEERFCGWLTENAATEYMEANVWRVIGCLTGSENAAFSVGGKFTGQTRFIEVQLGSAVVNVELEYSVLHRSQPDTLRILVAAPEE